MSSAAQSLRDQIGKQLDNLVFGLTEAIDGLTIALVARGHVLIEGVPGLGKTLLAKSFAVHTGGQFKRIQCTADLMPSDITGIHIFRTDQNQFELIPGPVFADVLLVDEINRTGPKTQSALLQAMEEGAVSIDRKTYPLSENFMVIASQNPADFEGTYPLPESQLDRFLLKLELKYPEQQDEIRILQTYDRPGGGHVQPSSDIQPLDEQLITRAREEATQIHAADSLYQYALDIGQASRVHPQVSLGLSTRGALSLMRCARVLACLQGRDFVTPDDIKVLAVPVMSHRLLLTPDTVLEGIQAPDIINSLLEQVEVPRQ